MKKVAVLLILIAQFSGTFAQASLDYVGTLSYTSKLNDIWGYTDTSGVEYALVCARNGFSIVSLADPASPQEVVFLQGPESIWRDAKTWGQYAYVVNETEQGLLIVDMGNLPVSVDTVWYREREFESAHNIFIDENGFAYLLGANIDNGGTTILDLNVDPLAPVFVGAYTERYVHDTYVRNDTMYNAEISNGIFTVIDVTDKSTPVLLGSADSPMGFAHNTWLSDDGKTVYVTDEYPGASITSYDVSDPTDMVEQFQYRSNPGTGVIPHNVFVLDDYLVNSYYRDGVTLADAHRPSNIVQIASFDTSPLASAGGFNGCWGVYPYLPSGLIIAADIEEGLFVLQPTFARAAYLEGQVTETSGSPLIYAKVELLGTDRDYITDFTGDYKLGSPDSGEYAIRVSASGCMTQIIDNVSLTQGIVTTVNPVLSCTSTAIIPVDPIALPELFASPTVFQSTTAISYSVPRPGAQLQVLDARGRLRAAFTLNTAAGVLSLGDKLEAGIYLISLSNVDHNKWIRVIKQP